MLPVTSHVVVYRLFLAIIANSTHFLHQVALHLLLFRKTWPKPLAKGSLQSYVIAQYKKLISRTMRDLMTITFNRSRDMA